LKCDINVNDRLGIENSQLIKAYCELHPALRPTIMALKTWAKVFGLNNPSTVGKPVSFSSYALTLMTIGFFQVCAFRAACEHRTNELDGADAWAATQFAKPGEKRKCA